MGTGKQYDKEFKKQAIKLAKEIGNAAAADELGEKSQKGRNRYRNGNTHSGRKSESCRAITSSKQTN